MNKCIKYYYVRQNRLSEHYIIKEEGNTFTDIFFKNDMKEWGKFHYVYFMNYNDKKNITELCMIHYYEIVKEYNNIEDIFNEFPELILV